MSFGRLVRFVPKGDSSAVLLGEPVDQSLDVGLAARKGEEVKVRVFRGTSALDVGKPTDTIEVVDRLLSPLTQREVGTIRCIGLNVSFVRRDRHSYDGRVFNDCHHQYKQHAREVNMDIPVEPTVFL
jgi:hypothetical protein